jgi:glucose-6-phosphate 1-dehydrogenase
VPVLIIRAGKTMPVTTTEVRIRFRPVPFDVFGVGRSRLTNTLKLWIWPDTEIGLALAGKKAGAGREPQLQDLVLPRTARRTCALRPPHRCRAERQPRTVRPPGHVKAAWRVDPMLGDIVPVHTYQRGTCGPKEADSQLPNGDDWHDPAG